MITQEIQLSKDSYHIILFWYLAIRAKKPAFCICENKGADQLRSSHAADQGLYFPNRGSTIPLLPISEISSFSQLLWLYSPVCIRPSRKSRRPVFSERGSYFGCQKNITINKLLQYLIFVTYPNYFNNGNLWFLHIFIAIIRNVDQQFM